MNEIKSQYTLLDSLIKSYLQGENPELKKELDYVLTINDQKMEEKLELKLINTYENPNEKP